MTFCIGAVCDDRTKTDLKIVLCADLERIAEGIDASETEDKLGFVKKGWPTLVAGTIARANELIDVYAEYLKEHDSEISEFNLIEHLRKAAHLQKQRLVEGLQQTLTRLTISGRAARTLPQTFISLVTDNISRIKLDGSSLDRWFLA